MEMLWKRELLAVVVPNVFVVIGKNERGRAWEEKLRL